jgi:hypothetical protein
VFVDPRWALLADAVSFLVAAGIFSGLPAMAALPRDGRPLAYQGIRVIAGQRVLRVVALLTWATFLSSGLPEALAPAVAPRTWIPYVMAGAATGGVIFAYLVARRAFLANVVNQVRTAAACAGALLFGGAAMLIHAPPWTILAANIAIGAASGWIIGAQATFAQLTPAGRMGQVEATMVATNIFVQGAGILGLGWLVTITHRPGLAYLAAGTTIAVVASYASAQFNNLQSAPAPSS